MLQRNSRGRICESVCSVDGRPFGFGLDQGSAEAISPEKEWPAWEIESVDHSRTKMRQSLSSSGKASSKSQPDPCF